MFSQTRKVMDKFKEAFNRERKTYSKRFFLLDIIFPKKKKSESEEKFYLLAKSSYYDNALKNALNEINSCIKYSQHNNWKYFAFRANVKEDLLKYSEAIDDYIMAIEINGNDSKVYALYHQIGYCYLNLNEDNKANEFYTHALNLKKELQETKEKDLEGLDKGILLGVSFAKIYNNRAITFKNLKKYELAINDCEKAIEFGKDYANPYLCLFQTYSFLKNEDKANENLEVASVLGNPYAIKTISKLISSNDITEKQIKIFLDKFSRYSDAQSMLLLINLLKEQTRESSYASLHLRNYLELLNHAAFGLRIENARKVLQHIGAI